VFPAGLEWVGEIVAQDAWHDAWWAARSSQTLALTLLAASVAANPTLAWFPLSAQLGDRRSTFFEVELAEHVLNERPRTTQLDALFVGNRGVIAVEAKFSERGFGSCSCQGRATGRCSKRVRERPYWAVAGELGLREVEGRCALSLAYQPMRNIAAVQAIAGSNRKTGFVLVYDERNPYFTGAERWPGWVAVLEDLSTNAETRFGTLTWQQLLEGASLDTSLVTWAREKHGLEPSPLR
jgi:hypothetical protein